MPLSIELLGKPRLSEGEVSIPGPRGRKAWALLAYLVCAEGNATREQLAHLLFDGADDPGRALRWNLTEIRRCLRGAAAIEGDPLRLRLEPGTLVDVHVLRAGTWAEAMTLAGLGYDLLQGVDPSASAAFESWLLNERRHLRAVAAAVLREAALAQLSRGRTEGAITSAARLVALEPLDEAYQALLIRSYALSGDDAAAARQLSACVDLFQRELGVEPGAQVMSAMRAVNEVAALPIRGAVAARAQLEAGHAAMKAGALDAALDCFERAAAEAHSSGDLELKAKTLVDMGSALVHCGRGRYEEGAALLHQAVEVTDRTGQSSLAAAAHRELAWVELLAARYQRVRARLDQAVAVVGDDLSEKGRISFVAGMAMTEMATYGRSMEHLLDALRIAQQMGDHREAALAQAMLGKAHLLRREMEPARRYLVAALDQIRTNGWTWLAPWPEAYLGELELLEGNITTAKDMLEHALAMAVQIGDPCFQSKAEATLGLVDAAQGRHESAIDKLTSARTRLVTTPDHTWTMAFALDALCEIVSQHAPQLAPPLVHDLAALAARTGMREHLASAYLHRHRLGDRDALEAARVIALDIDNPALEGRLEAASAHAPA